MTTAIRKGEAMKTVKLKLTLKVEYSPRGTSTDELKDYMAQIVEDAMNYGTLTCESDATVEHHSFKIEEEKF